MDQVVLVVVLHVLETVNPNVLVAKLIAMLDVVLVVLVIVVILVLMVAQEQLQVYHGIL